MNQANAGQEINNQENTQNQQAAGQEINNQEKPQNQQAAGQEINNQENPQNQQAAGQEVNNQENPQNQQAAGPQINDEPNYPVQKVLTQADIDGTHFDNLLLDGALVQDHMLPHVVWNEEILVGHEVEVMDIFDQSTVFMTLAPVVLNDAVYTLRGNWLDHFVGRRNLVAGEKIGIRWSDAFGCFVFKVLTRNVNNL